ncbi:MAG: translation elongation factor G [Bdellovibrionales bacterium RIFOXYD1_FULL_53_11]|nr:MAG: translation elongation factor G [Bdellovibrionales bacterium RIFOXYD1_FULL_53_11]
MAVVTRVSLDKVRNIGISAHIDSGKTTLTERVLFYTKKIHAIHEVKGKDQVGATMDFMDLEREKGITIQSAATYCMWKGYNFNLIDTPGHVDFTIEVERALRVLDGAVLVLCAVAGVQSQSLTVDRQMRRYKVPRLVFINKMDRAGANAFRCVKMLKEKLHLNAHLINYPIGAEDQHKGAIDLVTMRAFYFDGDNGEFIREEDIPAELLADCKKYREELIAAVGEFDDVVGNKYVEGQEPTVEEFRAGVRKATLSLKFAPVFCGSAYRNKGVQLLLDGVMNYLPNPMERENVALDQHNNEAKVILESNAKKPFVGLAFKLDETRYGQLTYMRMYQGSVAKGDFIFNSMNDRKVKVPRLVQMHADEMHEVEEAQAGDIVAMFGVDCSSGDTFTDGTIKYTMTSMFVPNAVISLAVQPKDKAAQNNFSKALNKFTKEDPTFRVHRDEESGQTIIAGMGELHLEIYCERMKREYACEVIVGKPQVAFRETITQKGAFNYTHKKQTGGAGQFGRVAGYMEPLPLDAGVNYEFVDDITGGVIPRQYIPACDKGFQEAVKEGRLIGFPIVGVRCVINDGAYHDVDSSEQAFKTASLMAFREGYERAGAVVLEPIMKLEAMAPEEFQGSVMGQINQRRGMIMNSSTNEGFCVVEAEVPLADMFGYATDLRSATQGKGEFTMEFCKYSPVPRSMQEEMIKKHQEKKAKDKK